METITLKRHKFRFYLTIILGTLAFAAIGTVVLLTYLSIPHQRHLSGKDKLMPFVSIAIYAVAVYSLYTYYKNAPLVSANDTAICIGNKTYPWADVTSIELTGKKIFPYFISYAMESITLHLSNGQMKYLYDDMYENAWELKSFLQQVVIDKKKFAAYEHQLIDIIEAENDYFETFSGSQLTSFTGILFWSFTGFLFCIVAFASRGNNASEIIGIIILFGIVFFLLSSRSMHYFKLSDNYLLVKNQNFFWQEKRYHLTNIAEVVFEAPPKSPNCLRVITKDFNTRLYPAAPLHKKTWLAMKDRLERHHIPVRNECIF